MTSTDIATVSPEEQLGRATQTQEGQPAPRSSIRRLMSAFRSLPLLVFPIGCGLASVAIGQDITGDTLLYHEYDAWAFLHGGRLLTDVFAAQYETLLNPLVDVPYYALQQHVAPTTAAFVMGCWQGLSPLLIFFIARRVTTNRLLPWFAAITSAVAGGFASELGSMMGDSTVAPFFLAGVLLAITAISRQSRGDSADGGPAPIARKTWPLWLFAGICAGLGVGLKFAEGASAVALVLAAAFTSGSLRRRSSKVAISAVGVAIGAAATGGYWSWFLWRNFGDPFAFTGNPLFIFHSAFFASNAQSAPWHAPDSFVQFIFYPVYWFFNPVPIVGIGIREASLPIAYLLILVLGLVTCLHGAFASIRTVSARRHRVADSGAGNNAGGSTLDVQSSATDADRNQVDVDRYLIAMFIITLFVWIKIFGTYRYLMPLELLSPVVAIVVLRRIVAAVKTLRPRFTFGPRPFALTFIAICVICVASETPSSYWARIPYGPTQYSVHTPAMFENGRLDVLVEEGSNPDGFVPTLLKANLITIGGTGRGGPTPPAIMAMQKRAFAAVRRSGGIVFGVWTTSAPIGSQAQYIASLGYPGLRQGRCVVENLYIGAGYEPVGFCEYLPISS